MPLTSAQSLRLKIADIPRLADKTFYGDGLASAFLLPDYNISSGSAYVPGTNIWAATGATFNESGMVSFSGVISANSAFRTTYVHSVFSETEVSAFLEEGGSVRKGALAALETLFFDAAKRASWISPDGTQYSDIGSIDALGKAYTALKEETLQEGAAAVSMQSWTINQENY
jgi:hypothetical protein